MNELYFFQNLTKNCKNSIFCGFFAGGGGDLILYIKCFESGYLLILLFIINFFLFYSHILRLIDIDEFIILH